MAVIAKQRYKLDVAPKGGWVIVYASQHDNGAREIEFEITNQGNAFSIPASINISVQGIKSNKSYFSHSCSYFGNIVTMALADDMTDVIGKAICVLKFTNQSNQKLATAKFVLNVDTDSSSEGIIIDTEAEEIFNQMLNDIRAQAASISADIAELQSMVGSPLVASTASAMTDHNKIYVYTGSESGYTNGNWYYWNGSAWTSGGVYNSVAVVTDPTLTLSGVPADAKATGDEVTNLRSDLLQTVYPSSYVLGYIDGLGQLQADSAYYSSDYIELKYLPGSKVSFKVSFVSARGLAFYDENKVYVPNSSINGTNCSDYGYTAGSIPQVVKIPIPKGARYVRFNQRSAYVSSTSDFWVTGVLAADYLSDASKIGSIVSGIESINTSLNTITQLKTSFTDGYFVNENGGTLVGDARYSASDYVCIDCFNSITYTQYFTGASACMALYDRDFNFVRAIVNSGYNGDINTISIQPTEYYARFSCFTANLASFSLSADENIANAIKSVADRIEDDRNTDVLFAKIIHDGGMTRIFNTIGVIGDSLSSGEMAYGNASGEDTTQYVDMFQYSWIQYMARECGITAYNFSQGGMNTRNFLNDLGGYLTKLQNADYKCQAYFIALGHNDYNYGVDVGTSADINISDPSQNADTYYGNYARIISIIKSVQPNAKIFCICMKSSGYSAYNTAIRYMATIYSNVYILDFETYYPKLETSWEYTQGHGNAMGYLNYSWQIGTYVDWIIRNNRSDFKYVQFIGTDYDQYIPTN